MDDVLGEPLEEISDQVIDEFEGAGQSGEGEELEEGHSGGGGGGVSGGRDGREEEEREGYFIFSRTQFREKTAESYGLKRTSYHLRVENPRNTFPVDHGNIVRAFEEGLANTIQEMIDGLPDYDRIQIYLGSSRLRNSHTSAHVSVEQWRDPLGASRQILSNISNLLNSNENFELDDTLQLDVTHITMPPPGSGLPKGKRKRSCFGTNNYDEFLKGKKSVIRIMNNDGLCCARAIIVSKAVADDHPQLKAIKDSRNPLQKKMAEKLQEEARVPLGPFGLNQIKLFENILNKYQFVVVSAEHGHAIIHKGPASDKQIMLLMHDGHFDVITTLPGFFDTNYFCLECEKAYKTEDYEHHTCNKTKCDACFQKKCPDYDIFKQLENPELHCKECNRKFYGATCQLNHLIQKANGQMVAPSEKNVCQSHKKCSFCLHLYTSSSQEHMKHCGLQYCPNCSKEVNILQHRCFLQPIDDVDNDKNTIFVYFDIEARQDTGNHIANLLCAETDHNDTQYTFKGEQCVAEFLEWIHSIANDESVDKVIVVAHNFKGYDSYFILQELYKQHVTNLNQVVNGAKILSLGIPYVKFIDSMNFFPMALSNFPKTFGLNELKKSFFPHFFNTPENQIYEGYIPDKKYYDPDGMSTARKQEFEVWYDEKVSQGYIFDFQHELLTYCQSDVRLLKQGCMKFQMQFRNICGFNPMEQCITIASACNMAYRKNWMPENQIAIQPVRGWRTQNNQSHAALTWLYWEEKQLTRSNLLPRIAHVRNKGERRIKDGNKSFLVDGYDEQTRTVYEFQGCFYHGCITCFPNRGMKHPYHMNKTMKEVREETRAKVQHLISLGYVVKEMWECEWQKKKQTEPRINEFIDQLHIVSPLNPREAFFGGRTDAIKLHHKTKDDEQISYNDMISLYPCANLECDYPVGHPQFTDQPGTTDISSYYGLVKCNILPPYELYHPVLPYRMESKLLFPLCRTCAQEQLKNPINERTEKCPHSPQERSLTGTWTTIELEKAIEKGYVITYIYEVWHFEKKSKELFSPYIKKFMKIKQQASGWPSECDTEEKREEYLHEYKDHEGIELDPVNIEKNPGLRSLAKLMLNSFWGKFGQRPNQTQVTTCANPSQFFRLIMDDRQVIHRIEIMNEHMVEVYHSFDESCIPMQTNVNIFVACFTTSYARLKLYKALDMLQERVLYMDTDSVIYTQKPGQLSIPTGNYLGQYTNELDEGDHIVEFVAAGPKNYAYNTKQGKQCCKVRGFTLNTRGQEILNFTSIKDLVLSEVLSEEDEDARTLTLHTPHKIIRCGKSKRIKTISQNKKYKLVFNKRVINADTYQSFPYGYKFASNVH